MPIANPASTCSMVVYLFGTPKVYSGPGPSDDTVSHADTLSSINCLIQPLILMPLLVADAATC